MILYVLGIVLLLTGCESSVESTKKEELTCDVFKCIELIDHSDKVEDINLKIGLIGKKNEYVDNSYEWNLSNDVKLRVIYDADGVTKTELVFDNKILYDESLNTKLLKKYLYDWGEKYKKYDDSVSALGKNGTIIFKRFKKYIDKVDIDTEYLWIKNDKCFISANYNLDNELNSVEINVGNC